MKYLITALICLAISITPAPIVPPSSEVNYDPNLAPNNIASYEVTVNKIYDSQCFKVYTDDKVAPIADANYIQIASPTYVDGQWVYNWSLLTSKRGLLYEHVTFTDSWGNTEVDITFMVHGGPVVTGCGSR